MILKHRDRELLRFEWTEPQGVRIVSVNEDERKFLPLIDRARNLKGFRFKRHKSKEMQSSGKITRRGADKNGWWEVLKQ